MARNFGIPSTMQSYSPDSVFLQDTQCLDVITIISGFDRVPSGCGASIPVGDPDPGKSVDISIILSRQEMIVISRQRCIIFTFSDPSHRDG
jgi:hypothetical protein